MTSTLDLVSILRPLAYATALAASAISGSSGSATYTTFAIFSLTLLLEAASRPST